MCKLVSDHYAPVIPPSDADLKRLIMLELHASGLGGHVASDKMLREAQRRFYWKHMRKDVERFCKECVTCQASRTSTRAPQGLLQPHSVPVRPFEHVSLDFVTSLPKTARGFDAVLTVVDKFSKLVTLIPCTTDVDAQETARLFFEHIVCKYGVPKKLVSDRDVRFTSLFW